MRYRTIVVDPPWDHSDGTGAKLKIGFGRTQRELPGGAVRTKLPYDVMALAAIAKLPVGELADERGAHLYIWTTNRFLRHVWDIAEAWGFTGICVLTWCKAPRGFLGGGTFPSTTEFCLFARRGNCPAIGRATSRWFEWPRRFGPPVAEGRHRKSMHSAKPEHFYDLIEQVSPGPYVELFARRHRLGWDVWGDQSANTAELAI